MASTHLPGSCELDGLLCQARWCLPEHANWGIPWEAENTTTAGKGRNDLAAANRKQIRWLPARPALCRGVVSKRHFSHSERAINGCNADPHKRYLANMALPISKSPERNSSQNRLITSKTSQPFTPRFDAQCEPIPIHILVPHPHKPARRNSRCSIPCCI